MEVLVPYVLCPLGDLNVETDRHTQMVTNWRKAAGRARQEDRGTRK